MTEVPGEFPIPTDVFERQRALLTAHVEAESRPSRRPRRRTLVVVAAAIAIGVILVTPPLGIGGRLVDLLQGTPAPPEIQTYFAASNAFREEMLAHADEAGARLHDLFSPVIASEARGVFAIESPDGPIYLWAAPTQDGRQCWLIQAGAEVGTGRPFGSGSCDATERDGALRFGMFWTAERPSVQIAYGRVYDDAVVRVDVELDGAETVSLPVVAGYGLGTVPKEERVLGAVARDADGDEVARQPLRP